jgi:hypothetical protein
MLLNAFDLIDDVVDARDLLRENLKKKMVKKHVKHLVFSLTTQHSETIRTPKFQRRYSLLAITNSLALRGDMIDRGTDII